MLNIGTKVTRLPPHITNVYCADNVVIINLVKQNNRELTILHSYFEPNDENILAIANSFFGEGCKYEFMMTGLLYTIKELRCE